MKKIISLILALIFLFTAFTGCGQSDNVNGDISKDSDGKISVVATIFPSYDFIREIAGNHVELTMLLPPGSESHSFEPTPQDIITIQNCDVFVYVGGESDSWIDGILESMDTGNMEIISLIDLVEVVEEEIVEGMEEEEHDHENEDDYGEETEYDEHVWTSPKNAKLIVQALSDTLCETDTANAPLYRESTSAYLSKLDALDASFGQVVDNAVRKTIVFGDRFPFRYFADAYGLDYFAAFPGCSTETEPSAATVAFLVNKIRDEEIPVIFHAELSNEKMTDTIAMETGAKKLLLHACHNVSKSDFESGASYLSLMTRNVENLKEVLW